MSEDTECTYHAARASAEAVRAITAGDGPAAAIHQELCLAYSGRVIAALILSAAGR